MFACNNKKCSLQMSYLKQQLIWMKWRNALKISIASQFSNYEACKMLCIHLGVSNSIIIISPLAIRGRQLSPRQINFLTKYIISLDIKSTVRVGIQNETHHEYIWCLLIFNLPALCGTIAITLMTFDLIQETIYKMECSIFTTHHYNKFQQRYSLGLFGHINSTDHISLVNSGGYLMVPLFIYCGFLITSHCNLMT